MTKKTHIHVSDLAGLTRLATDITAELAELRRSRMEIASGLPVATR